MQERVPCFRQQSTNRCENRGQEKDPVDGQQRQTVARNRETEKRSQ